ncbi:MAG: SDR family oxidoreductase [Pyrinomonadaceae bacterium]
MITGAASGIGLATAQLLYERGASIALVDIDQDLGRQALTSLGADAHHHRAAFFCADLSQPEEAEAVVHLAAQKLGRLNALINSAGVQRYGNAEETSLELWQQVLAVNLTAAFLTARAAVPYFRQHPGGGAIVNVGSVQSHAAQRGAVAYVTSKHALLGLTRAMAVDYAHERIRVNCVCPGTIDTPMFRATAAMAPDPASIVEACERMHPPGASPNREKVAETIAFLVSDAASFITGTAIDVDGGLLALIGGSPKESTK